MKAASRSAPQQGGPGKEFQIEVSFVSEASHTMSRQQDLHVLRECLSHFEGGEKKMRLPFGARPVFRGELLNFRGVKWFLAIFGELR